MAEKGKKIAEKKTYNKSYQSLLDIWDVLREFSSPERPMSVAEITAKLNERENAPSGSTVARLFPEKLELLNALFPGKVICEDGQESVVQTYRLKDSLHIVLEDRARRPLFEADVDGTVSRESGPPISQSTVDRLLRSMFDSHEMHLTYANDPNAKDDLVLPVQLKCVAACSVNGKTVYKPYDEVLDRREQGKGDRSANNLARRYYLSGTLEPFQWRMLTDMIQVYPYIGAQETRQMLSALRGVFPGCGNTDSDIYAYKRETPGLFHKLDILNHAIRQQQQVNIWYGEYRLQDGPDGQQIPVLVERVNPKNDNPHAATYRFDPYALMWSNGYYYLIGKQDWGMMNLRVDRILNVTLTVGEDHRFERPADLNLITYREKSPVMYAGKPEFVRLRCKVSMVNTILDFFGSQASFSKPDEDGWTEVRMHITPSGVRLFASQYAPRVEVLEPVALREELRQNFEAALALYR